MLDNIKYLLCLKSIDKNILEFPSSKKKNPLGEKHIRVFFDEESQSILIRPNVYVDTKHFTNDAIKWTFMHTIPYLQIDPKKASAADYEAVKGFFLRNKYHVLIRAEEFYNITNDSSFVPPEHNQEKWYIDNGIMYTETKDAIDTVFCTQTYL